MKSMITWGFSTEEAPWNGVVHRFKPSTAANFVAVSFFGRFGGATVMVLSSFHRISTLGIEQALLRQQVSHISREGEHARLLEDELDQHRDRA